ncbi:DUF2480 family protein [Eisenibacter elegans]|jgi:hypothetical protein|uniref:DUF2480 family protein n=1 Tax=Eisenibacter elegans TaxID=997 RepID=UPI000408EFAC|nr:DUF2480 family protein [Eisenibacter elegans]
MITSEEPIVNRVAGSGLITLDLADFYPEGERVLLDLKGQLFQEMILREKDFRAFVKEHPWADYAGKHVAITCSVEAIIPAWAYMLVSTALAPYATTLIVGDMEALELTLFRQALAQLDLVGLEGQKVVVKGCGKLPIPPAAYAEVSRLLQPVADSLMYGEPCSTVPIYKRKKNKA